jgi:hypothetical protein
MIIKTIALDSSVLGNLCRDKGKSGRSAGKSKRALISLYQNGLIPTITIHHVMELIQHDNDDIVRQRLQYLREIPHAAFLESAYYEGHFGSTVDLLTREADAQVEFPNATFTEIAQLVRGRIFYFGTGQQGVDRYTGAWDFLRQNALNGVRRQREVSSISHAQVGVATSLRLGEIRKMPRRSQEDSARVMLGFPSRVHRELIAKGDKKLTTSARAATQFAATVSAEVLAAMTSENDPFEWLLSHSGIDRAFINDNLTIEEYGNLAIFSDNLAIINESRPNTKALTLRNVNPDKCPSWVIRRWLGQCTKAFPRANGSDLTDGFLSGLLPYVDVLIVDKRTCHHLERLVRDHKELAGIGVYPSKFPAYEHLESWLSESRWIR